MRLVGALPYDAIKQEVMKNLGENKKIPLMDFFV